MISLVILSLKRTWNEILKEAYYMSEGVWFSHGPRVTRIELVQTEWSILV